MGRECRDKDKAVEQPKKKKKKEQKEWDRVIAAVDAPVSQRGLQIRGTDMTPPCWSTRTCQTIGLGLIPSGQESQKRARQEP